MSTEAADEITRRKNKIRRELAEKRMRLSKEEQMNASERLCERLIQNPLIWDAEILLLYHAKVPEVSLETLFHWARKQHKITAFPRVEGRYLHFYEVDTLLQLEQGGFGILEPSRECRRIAPKRAICLVPGLGFDKKGNRIGYGKGYYDRYLANAPELTKIGIAYEVQLTEALPTDENDIKMDGIVMPSAEFFINEA